jgi:cytochrome c oxidase subunit 2
VTELGARVDTVQLALILLMGFWFIACNAVMVYFLFRYKRKGPEDETSTARGNHMLEVVWTVVPTIIVVIIFVAGIDVWTDMRTPPENTMDIRVRGQKWSWTFIYEGNQNPELSGRVSPSDLYIPAGVPVKFNMKSQDVLHSMFIPEFRVKEDVVPSQFTYLWFQADKPGVYNIFCTEYCGDQHSGMLGKVYVLDQAAWERFLANEPIDPKEKKRTPLENGEYLYVKYNCKGCHSIDGTANIGPTFQGLYGREEIMADNATITADDNYIMESIKQPEAKLVKGFAGGQMPAFEGLLTDDQIADIITYIKTLN